MAKQAAVEKSIEIIIKPPKLAVVTCGLVGTAQYVANNCDAVDLIRTLTGAAEDVKRAKAEKKSKARDFIKPYETSKHTAVTEGMPPHPIKKPWCGIPCAAFRWALVDVCRLIPEVDMTQAKMLVFIEADGWDESGEGIVKIKKGTPESFNKVVRCPPGPQGKPNVATRARWPEWSVDLRVRFDASIIKPESVANLVTRAGMSCGVGAGRPFSKTSPGMGWGTWKIEKAA